MFDQQTIEMLLVGVWDTLYMTVAATFFSYVFGMVMGVTLVVCRKDGIRPNAFVYSVLDVVVNLTRSFPFLILMIAVIPFTRFLVGTTIGNNATVVPLVLAAFSSRFSLSRLSRSPSACCQPSMDGAALFCHVPYSFVPSIILNSCLMLLSVIFLLYPY